MNYIIGTESFDTTNNDGSSALPEMDTMTVSVDVLAEDTSSEPNTILNVETDDGTFSVIAENGQVHAEFLDNSGSAPIETDPVDLEDGFGVVGVTWDGVSGEMEVFTQGENDDAPTYSDPATGVNTGELFAYFIYLFFFFLHFTMIALNGISLDKLFHI